MNTNDFPDNGYRGDGHPDNGYPDNGYPDNGYDDKHVDPDENALRQWLIDHLVETAGIDPADIDPDASMADLGVGSRDSAVLAGELADRLGRAVSPVELWEHPSINALVAYFVHGEVIDVPAAAQGGAAIADEPIAVVGMGCRLPGGIGDPEAYWQFLVDQGNAVTEVPAERWAAFDDGTPAVRAALDSTTRWGSYLDDIDGFDAEFFEITAREAMKMDPQQRLLLEVAWEALEHAGIPAGTLKRSATGVFVGACVSEYGFLASTDLPGVDAWNNLGGALSIIANRLSYFLDLRGPSMTIDTACSSSLVAIHLAAQSLRVGDCDVALAAGVNLLLSPAVFHGFDQSAALSAAGACQAFDADADGFVRGEGCGVVVLKRLGDAWRDGDRVLAVVKGSAVNQDGHSNGLFAPNPAAQMEVLRSAYANASVGVRDVDYVEAHGTGTLLGDPIEARALGTVLGRGRPADHPLLLGAVKSNLGHVEAAAGVVGFIKTVLAIGKGVLPPNLHYRNPNPHIPFEQLRLKVVDKLTPWPETGAPRRAGISSFGFGGTNAHIVIEQPPVVRRPPVEPVAAPATVTLVVSGKSPARVAATAGAVADWMTGAGSGVPLPDVAHTLNHHRATLPLFGTVTARDRQAAIDGLRALADGRGADGVTAPVVDPVGPGTVFVFSGQGSHWTGMARQLLTDEPAFAAAIDEIEPLFVEHIGFSLRDTISDGRTISGDAQVQPVLVGLQIALTTLWGSYGVHPDAVLGQSVGEVSAAVVAGALSLADGLRVVGVRSELMGRLGGSGAVALVRTPGDEVAALLAGYPGIEIAGRLAPRQTVVAGPVDAVDALIAAVTSRGLFARRVNMAVASHTALMDPILPELRSALTDLRPRPPRIPMHSTVGDDALGDAVSVDADYWVANIRRPVSLSRAVGVAAAQHATFIEISPHPMLTQAIAETFEAIDAAADRTAGRRVLGTLTRDGDDTVVFHTAVNATAMTRPPHTPHPPEPHPVLPSTPWQHTRYWMPTPPALGSGRGCTDPGGDHHTGSVDSAVPAQWWHQLDWPTVPLPQPAVSPGSAGRWLIIGEATEGYGALLGAESVTTLPAAVLDGATLAADTTLAATDLAGALAEADHVVFQPAPAVDKFAAAPGYALFSAARRLVTAAAAAPTHPRVRLVTRNGQPIVEGDHAAAGHAMLWGLGRTVALEHPEIWGGVVDVDGSVPAPIVARYVLAEATGDDTEDQVVYRAGKRHVPRLRPARPLPAPVADEVLDRQGAHLVIGATGNIGPHLIRHLAATGAGTVIAVSRNPGTRLDGLVAELAGQGTTVIPVAADSADEGSMAPLIARFGADLPPLRGVYLAAFGGGPAELATMGDDEVAAMFRPKLDALAILHRLTEHTPVDRFVLFSSISGLTGSRWLGHYAATTTYLDAFAYARRAAGLAATTVNWGLWKSLADGQDETARQVTTDSGLQPMADAVAISALASITEPNAPVRSTVVAADWVTLATVYRTRAAVRILDDLVGDDGAQPTGESAFRARLRETAAGERHAVLSHHVAELVAAVMGLSPHELDPNQGFFQFGMDSLMSVTLQRALSDSLGDRLPTSVVFDYPTVAALTGYLASTLPELADLPDDEPAADDYDDLSEDDLLKALSERLG